MHYFRGATTITDGVSLGLGKSVLEPSGISSLGHRGSFWQFFREACTHPVIKTVMQIQYKWTTWEGNRTELYRSRVTKEQGVSRRVPQQAEGIGCHHTTFKDKSCAEAREVGFKQVSICKAWFTIPVLKGEEWSFGSMAAGKREEIEYLAFKEWRWAWKETHHIHTDTHPHTLQRKNKKLQQ